MKDTLKWFPKITLWVLLAIGLIAFGAVFLLGNEATGLLVAGDELPVPKCTDFYLITAYAFVLLACLFTLFFVVKGFVEKFKQDKKSAIFTLCVLVGLVLLFVICWFLGSPEKIDIIGYEGTDNVGGWAQLSDMMMYVTYILFLGGIGTVIWGFIYTRLKK